MTDTAHAGSAAREADRAVQTDPVLDGPREVRGQTRAPSVLDEHVVLAR